MRIPLPKSWLASLFALLLVLGGLPASAAINGANDLRLSDMGGSGSVVGGAFNAATAYNSTAREWLVVWEGAELDAAANQIRIYGQRVDAVVGAEVGANDFLIAEVAGGPDPDLDARQPAVAYSPTSDVYLVVYTADVNAVTTEIDVYGQLVNGDGTLSGTPFLVGDCGSPGDSTADVGVTFGVPLDITYNATDDDFAVVYRCDDVGDSDSNGDGTPGDVAALVNGEFEILLQIVNSDGSLALNNDVQVSFAGGANGANIEFDAESPAVTWNSTGNEYLVVWGQDTPALGDGNREIFARRVSNAGVPNGAEFKVSTTAHAGSKDSAMAGAAYNPDQDEYLVVWSGDIVTDGLTQVYGQRVNANGTLDGGNFAVSQNGTATNGAGLPRIVYNTLDDQFMVSWQASTATVGELEIFVQRLTTTGSPVGPNDLRVSDIGANTNTNFDVAMVHGLAWAGAPLNTYFAVWDGDDNRSGQVDDEVEVYGQQIEPVLEVVKAITSTTTNLDAEDTVEYTLTVRHKQVVEGADTHDASLRNAVEVAVADDLPALFENVQLVSANILDGASTTDVSANFSINGSGDLQTDTRVDLNLFTNGSQHQRLEVVLSGRLPDSVSPDDVVPANTVAIDWRNRPALVHPEYDDAAASGTATIVDPFAVAKAANVSEAVIGQEITYTVTTTVVEGTTTNLQWVDTLPANTTYVSGSLAVSNANGMTINGLTDNGGPAGSTLTIDATSVVNPGNVDAGGTTDTDAFSFTYRVRVNNVVANQNGTVLSNDVDATADGVAADLDNQTAVTVREPVLTVAKAADDTTVGYGQTVTFTVTLTHAGSTADAFDIVVVDTLPAGLSYVPASVSGASLTSQVGQTLTFDAGDLALATGNKAFTYQAQVAAEGVVSPGAMLTNNLAVTWTSLDGASAFERTGADGPGGAVNDYATSGSETVTVTVPNLSTSSKSVSDAVTGNNDGQAQGGETLRYTITVANTGTGPATNVVVTDAPPANTSLDVGSVATNCAGGVVTTGNTGGDTSVQVDVASVAVGSCTVTFDVTMDNPVAAGVTQISNSGNIASDELATVVTNTVNTTVDADPDFTTSTKAASDAVSGDNDGLAQPGEVITFTVSVVNSGDQDATSVVVTDAAPTDATFDAGSVGTTCTGATITTGNGGGDTSVQVDVPTLAGAGASCEVTFTVTVDDPLTDGVTQICNTADIDSAETASTPTNSACISTDASPDLSTSTKAVSDASGNNDGLAQPGETLDYTVTVTNSGDQGATNVVVTDAAITDAALVSGSVTSSCAGATVTTGNGGGDTSVQVDVPSLAGGGTTCDVQFQVVVDTPLSAASAQVCNVASLSADGLASVDTNNVCINVDAAPDLSTSGLAVLDASTDGFAQAAETLTYTVSVTNSGDQEATNLQISDTAPANTTFTAGTVASSCAGAVVTTGNGGGDTSVVVDVPSLAGGGANCEVSYDVVVDNPIPAGVTQIANSATITADGIAIVVSTDSLRDELQGQVPGGVPDAFATNMAIIPVDGVPSIVLSKSVVDASTDGEAQPAEVLTYTIELTNVGTQDAADVSVTDAAPAGTSGVQNLATTCPGATANTDGTTLTVDGFTLTGGGGSCQVTFEVTVDDPPAVATISNTATVEATGVSPVNSNQVDLVVDLPTVVTGSKVASGTFVTGDLVTYVITLENLGPDAQGDNPGDEFVDVLPPELELVSATATSGTVTEDFPGNTVRWNGSLAVSATVEITIEAEIVADSGLVSNQGTINYDSNGDGTNDASGPTDDPATAGADDPTNFTIGASPTEIPTLSDVGRLALILALLAAATSVMLRRREATVELRTRDR